MLTSSEMLEILPERDSEPHVVSHVFSELCAEGSRKRGGGRGRLALSLNRTNTECGVFSGLFSPQIEMGHHSLSLRTIVSGHCSLRELDGRGQPGGLAYVLGDGDQGKKQGARRAQS